MISIKMKKKNENNNINNDENEDDDDNDGDDNNEAGADNGVDDGECGHDNDGKSGGGDEESNEGHKDRVPASRMDESSFLPRLRLMHALQKELWQWSQQMRSPPLRHHRHCSSVPSTSCSMSSLLYHL